MAIKEKIEEWWITSEFSISKNQFIAVIVLALIISLSWLYYYFKEAPKESEVKIVEQASVNKPKDKKVSTKLFVHVAGEVKNPGAYEIEAGSRIFDAIRIAGGFTNDADPNSLNLAKKVSDAEKITVLKKGGQTQIQESETISTELVNLNTANVEELEELPGIGEVMAKRIFEFRQTEGSFNSVEQLKEIEGIGDKKFEKIKEKVTI